MKLLLIILLITCLPAYASNWQNWFLRPDQQGARLLASGKAKQAAQRFQSMAWKGTANYRAKQYQQAVHDFGELNTSVANYNRGNALAYMGQYKQAITAYDKAISLKPDFHDAIHNKKIVEKLLKQRKKHKNKQQSNHQKKQPKHQQQTQQNKKHSSAKQNKQQGKHSGQHKKQQQQKNKLSHGSSQHQKLPDKNKSDKQRAKIKHKNTRLGNNKKMQPARQRPINIGQQQAHITPLQKKTNRWLQQIPDDPGGLLRQKFLRDYLRRQRQHQW